MTQRASRGVGAQIRVGRGIGLVSYTRDLYAGNAAGYPATRGLRMLKWLYVGYTPYAVRWVPALLECLCGAARGTTGCSLVALFVK